MSIWQRIFESATESESERTTGAIGRFVTRVRRWTCPYFGNCADLSNKDKHRDRSSTMRKTVYPVAFTVAVVVLSAKLAKADGIVTRDEVAAFKQLFTIPEKEEQNVGRLFDQARKDAGGFERYARQVGDLFAEEKPVLTDLLGCLMTIAAADGEITEAESDFLRSVSREFGLDDKDYRDVAKLYAAKRVDDPFVILDVSPKDDLETVRTAYRRLVRANHPDLLAAKGVPQERLDKATQAMARITEAYRQVSAKLDAA